MRAKVESAVVVRCLYALTEADLAAFTMEMEGLKGASVVVFLRVASVVGAFPMLDAVGMAM